MCSWGAVTAGLAGAHNFSTVAALRFILGAAEAGLFPGFVFYLTFWYKKSERSLRVAIILASATLAGAFGGAIAYGVGHMNGVRGLSAWRWLFIIEGLPSVASSLLILFFLPDYPESAKWLTPEERTLAIKRLEGEGSQGDQPMTWQDARDTLINWLLYAQYIVSFCVCDYVHCKKLLYANDLDRSILGPACLSRAYLSLPLQLLLALDIRGCRPN